MSYAFISYKTDDVEVARWVKEKLEEKGIPCWFAPVSIPGGSNYAKEIPKAIRNSSAFILILSKTTHESKYVPKEIDLAINTDKLILPFMIDDFELSDDFGFYLSNVNRFPAYESREKCIDLIASRIQNTIIPPPPPPPLPPPPPVDRSSRSFALTLLLAIFLGYFGIHRFYTGKIVTGIIWFFTGGLGCVGWIADVILILFGAFKDSEKKAIKYKKKAKNIKASHRK